MYRFWKECSPQALFWGPSLVLALLVIGCGGGGDGRERHAVSGTVTFRSRPLPWGTISFEPVEPDPMGGSAAEIQDGKFEIPTARGLSPGVYRVRITGSLNPADNPEISGPPTEETPSKDMVPAAHNANSKHTAEVKRGASNQFTFDLK